MKYKLLAVDFDLTLSRADRSVSERNQKAIRRAEEQGLRVVLSSGRVPAACQMVLPYFSPDTPANLGNGTVLYLPRTGELLQESLLPEETALLLMDWFCARREGVCVVWSREQVYTSANNEFSERYCRTCGVASKSLTSPEALAREGVVKLLYYGEEEVVSRVTAEFRAAPPARVSYFPSGIHALELVAPGVNKGTGLLRCAELLGIAPEETVAIGDSGNDVDMLRTAALGVAVENASADVKAVARQIVPSCEEDGVAVLIEQLLQD